MHLGKQKARTKQGQPSRDCSCTAVADVELSKESPMAECHFRTCSCADLK